MINDANVVLCEEAFDVRKLIREIKTITEMRAAEDGKSSAYPPDFY